MNSRGTTNASRNALETHITWVTDASKSAMIVGVATVTIVPSTRIMKNPTRSAASASHASRSETLSVAIRVAPPGRRRTGRTQCTTRAKRIAPEQPTVVWTTNDT